MIRYDHLFSAVLMVTALPGCISPTRVQPQQTDRVFETRLSATAAQVTAFTGQAARLAFVDRTGKQSRLCFIDFNQTDGAAQIQTIAAAQDPSLPVISPDGNWVVYASGAGSEAGSPVSLRSSVYLCRLAADAQPLLIAGDSACEPRFVHNQPEAGQLTIIYPTLAPNCAWEGYGATMLVTVDISAAVPVAGTPQVLCADGSYTGGLSWDGRYLFGGGAHVARLDLLGGARRPDTISCQLIQSCNASVSSSRIFTDALLYLNTGGSIPQVNGGARFSTWQALLIGNSRSGVLRGYSIPDTASLHHAVETVPPSVSMIKWHHCEWSNHPYFAVATLNVDRYFADDNGYVNTYYQERIYLINLRDSTFLEVLRPDAIRYSGTPDDISGLYWPWLWVEVPAGFNESTTWLTES